MKITPLARVLAHIILIGLIFLEVIYLFIPSMPCAYFSDNQYRDLEKKYSDVSKYTPSCNHLDIMTLAYHFRDRGEIEKCKEWMMRANKCISLYKNRSKNITLLKNYVELCKKRDRK